MERLLPLCTGRGLRSDPTARDHERCCRQFLVGDERIEALLLDLGASIGRHIEENIVGDLLIVLAINLAGCGLENTDGEVSVASGRIRNAVELIVGDDVLVEAPLHAGCEDIVRRGSCPSGCVR